MTGGDRLRHLTHVRWLTAASLVTLLCLTPARAASVRFPLRPSSNARVLVDADGQPFPILGRSSWFALLLSRTDLDHYLDDSTARGFNAFELLLIGRDPRGRHVPFDDAGTPDGC